MRNSRSDVVDAALRVLDRLGLESCSMRRIASELDVQPSALYHHVPDKQTLLALMADEIVAGVGGGALPDDETHPGGRKVHSDPGDFVASPGGDHLAQAAAVCQELRAAMLSVRDGADVVSTASAYRLGASRVEQALADLVGPIGARTLLAYTFGHAQSTQTYEQAVALGAITPQGAPVAGTQADSAPANVELAAQTGDEDLFGPESFTRGLELILAGLATDVDDPASQDAPLVPRGVHA